MPSFGKKKTPAATQEFDLGPSITETRTRSRKLIIAGVVLAVCSGVGSFVFLQRAQTAATEGAGPQVSVLVAKRTIPARQAITVDDIQIRSVAVDSTNAQGTFNALEQVLGRTSSITILQGQLVTSNLFTFSADAGSVAILSPEESFTPESPEWRAVSLAVPDDRAVGGLLTAGARVDIFVTTTINVPEDAQSSGQFYGDKSTKVTYQDVSILTKAGTFYVIKVTEAVAEEIAHMQASGVGSFSMALRPDVDNRPVDASRLGSTTNLIIQRYGLPVPQPYPVSGQSVPIGPAPSPLTVPVNSAVIP
jgi:Flp pilus assembly protein CpaB